MNRSDEGLTLERSAFQSLYGGQFTLSTPLINQRFVFHAVDPHCGWLLLKCSAVGIGFNGAETNCGIAHILGILLMNSYNTDIFFSNYYNLQSVHFEWPGGCFSKLPKTFRARKTIRKTPTCIF